MLTYVESAHMFAVQVAGPAPQAPWSVFCALHLLSAVIFSPLSMASGAATMLDCVEHILSPPCPTSMPSQGLAGTPGPR